MSTNQPPTNPTPATPSAGTYTPGYAKCKLLMVLGGIVLFILGFVQVATPLRLIAFGKRATAEATVVVKTKEGLPDKILTDDLQVQAAIETRDRSYIFWNDFKFHAEDGSVIQVRAPIGSLIKPLYPLSDADGLPTSDLVYYNPAHPQQVVFPRIMSTWFEPGVLMVAGLACALIGGTLYYWANKPIELPHIA